MPTDKELLEAAAYVIAYADGVKEQHATDLLLHAVALAKARLSEHPEDDAVPVDEAFVRSIGNECTRDDGTFYEVAVSPHLTIRWVKFTLKEGRKIVRRPHCQTLWAHQHLPDVETRGDVRRLAKALRIELKE